MLKKAIIIGLGTFLTISLWADFLGDFTAATDLYGKQKYQEAQEAFVKLADSAPTPKSKAECLAYAAASLSRQKKYDEALDLAKKIAVKPISINCQMEIMLQNEKRKELIGAFKDEDISAWPDYIIQKGFFNRGTAYANLTDLKQNAAKDLEKAVENAGSDERLRITALHVLGNAYLSLKDDQKALDNFQKVSSLKGWNNYWRYYSSVLSGTEILIRQAKYDDALAELKKIDISKTSGDWKFLTLQAYGDIYVAQGQKDEGIAKYREALETKDVAKIYIDQVDKKLNSLNNK